MGVCEKPKLFFPLIFGEGKEANGTSSLELVEMPHQSLFERILITGLEPGFARCVYATQTRLDDGGDVELGCFSPSPLDCRGSSFGTQATDAVRPRQCGTSMHSLFPLPIREISGGKIAFSHIS